MPKVNTVQKARNSQGACSCGHKIEAGESYKWIKFRYGGRRIKCANCHFRSSELTNSDKLSRVYAAQENAEDALESLGSDFDDIEDVKSILTDMASELQEVADEYRESCDNIRERFENSPTADECEEKAEQLEDWISTLEDFDPDEFEFDGDDTPTECEECGGEVTPQTENDEPTGGYDCNNDECGYTFEPDKTFQELKEEQLTEWKERVHEEAQSAIDECPL